MTILIPFLIALCCVLGRCVWDLQTQVEHRDTIVALYRMRNKKQAGEIDDLSARNRSLARENARLARELRTGLDGGFESTRVDL